MIWRLHSRPLACALALGALLLAGCGADEEGGIPPEDAAALTKALDRLDQQYDDQECTSLPEQIAEVEKRVAELPDTVDPELRDALTRGVGRLSEVEDCEPPEPEPTTPAPPTTAPTTPPEPIEPPTTEDTEPETETETETETEEVEPPDDSSGSNGQGQGGSGQDSGSLPPGDDDGGNS